MRICLVSVAASAGLASIKRHVICQWNVKTVAYKFYELRLSETIAKEKLLDLNSDCLWSLCWYEVIFNIDTSSVFFLNEPKNSSRSNGEEVEYSEIQRLLLLGLV